MILQFLNLPLYNSEARRDKADDQPHVDTKVLYYNNSNFIYKITDVNISTPGYFELLT